MKHTTKLLSILLSLLMLIGLLPMTVFAEDAEAQPAADISVFVSLSQNGSLLQDKAGKTVAFQTVTVKDRNQDGKLDIDEALFAAHEAFYPNGAAEGYAVANSEYGLSLTKLWGNSSGMYGYYVNGASAWSMSDEIKENDHIEAFIYQNAYPDTEGYALFDVFAAENQAGSDLEITLTYVSGYDDVTWDPIFSPLADATITVNGVATEKKSGADGKVCLRFEAAGTYIISAEKTKEVNEQSVAAITAPVCAVTVCMPDARITVPADATLFVGTKGQVGGKDTHFVAFNEIDAKVSTENVEDGTKSYYFDLANNKTYNYRVSGENYITTAGTFKKTADYSLTVDTTLLQPAGLTKTTVDHDVTSNNGYNMADVYMNINAQGYLRLEGAGSTYQLIAIRNWQTVDSTTNNYFIEPDYHYTVLDENGQPDSSVITISDSGLITAAGAGTAIVLVTYDAINVSNAVGGPFFGAIWPENTGVFVVSVGADESGIATGMTINEGKNTDATTQKMSLDAIDAELDVIYFTGAAGSYTFTPETEACTVSVANPTVSDELAFSGFTTLTKNADDSFTVTLKEGRNIVKLEKDGKAEYQVITAKHVSYTVNDGIPVIPGDTVKITFDTLFHPANKLAGIYNMSALAIYSSVDAYTDTLIGTSSAQYNYASTPAAQTVAGGITKKSTAFGVSYTADKNTVLTVPADWDQASFTLKDGYFVATGYGDPFGNHRGITLTDGKAPNLNASMREGYMGKLPDISISITGLDALSITKQPTKTEYNIGDSFDPAGMVVKAVYSGGVAVEVESYTYPETAFETAGQQQVTITYTQGGVSKTTTVDVTVSEAELDHIAITTAPAKTDYQVNENFDSTGMVVTAYYTDETSNVINTYTLSHGKLISTDENVTVSYNGKTALQPVSVTGRVLSSIAITVKPTKLTYAVGEYLDPTGMTVTATYNDTTKDDVTAKVSIANTPFSAVGKNKTVKVTYVEGSVTKTANISGITVTEAELPETPVETITVYFTLLGDEAHDSDTDGKIHTLKNKNLTEWIEETAVTVNSDAKVIDVIAKALGMNGIPYSNPTGNYVESVRALGEFTNGANSGWMYTLNGEYPDLGVAEQTLEEGDCIVFHYTDNYMKEFESEEWNPGPAVTTEKKEDEVVLTFVDVAEDAYYSDAVKWAVKNEITTGVDEEHFDPDSDCTREQVVTFLWRAAGSPVVNYAMNFEDVPADTWYTEAVRWAVSVGITNGVDDTHFGTSSTCSRAQIVTFLFRYDKTNTVKDQENIFKDVAEGDFYYDAVLWALENNITNGTSEDTFDPAKGCTRAQVVTFLYRYLAQ